MKLRPYLVVLSVILAIIIASCAPQKDDQNDKPKTETPPSEPTSGMEAMNARGDRVMGFDHLKTTHHFRLFSDGGAIEVEANDAKDSVSRDQISWHLTHIANMFAAGDFNAPMLIHGQTPSGVPTMQRLKGEIKYQFEETDRGGRVLISTRSPEGVAAIHEFLRFQIKEHQTGDTTEVTQQF
jgi:hypothetical protein